jgi:hypothetical protein
MAGSSGYRAQKAPALRDKEANGPMASDVHRPFRKKPASEAFAQPGISR